MFFRTKVSITPDWQKTRVNSLRQCRRYRNDFFLLCISFSLTYGIWIEETATNPAQTGSILALAGAMTGNSDKCARRRCRCAALHSVVVVTAAKRDTGFLSHDDDESRFFCAMMMMSCFFFTLQVICSRD